MPKLWKTTIEIYTDFDPKDLELSTLAREAESGSGLCTKMEIEPVEGEVPGVTDHDLFNTGDSD
jgi:hypothetical protein